MKKRMFVLALAFMLILPLLFGLARASTPGTEDKCEVLNAAGVYTLNKSVSVVPQQASRKPIKVIGVCYDSTCSGYKKLEVEAAIERPDNQTMFNFSAPGCRTSRASSLDKKTGEALVFDVKHIDYLKENPGMMKLIGGDVNTPKPATTLIVTRPPYAGKMTKFSCVHGKK